MLRRIRSNRAMNKTAIAIAAAGLVLTVGCQEAVHAPARVDVPQRPGEGMRHDRDEIKPLPGQGPRSQANVPAPFDDVPLVAQDPPEQKAYLRAYNEVGRPRLVIAVNRGAMPEADTARASGGGQGGGDNSGAHAVPLRSIDTEAIENILTDWFAADGQVDIISPLAQNRSLTEAQKIRLREGQGEGVAHDLGGDVVVKVAGRITEQAGQDLELRMVAEALNVGDGRSLGRAVIDVPAPLDKPKINRYTRFMARKLMDGMILSWQRMAKDGPPAINAAPLPASVNPPTGQPPLREPEQPAQAPAPQPSAPTPAPPPAPEPAAPAEPQPAPKTEPGPPTHAPTSDAPPAAQGTEAK